MKSSLKKIRPGKNADIRIFSFILLTVLMTIPNYVICQDAPDETGSFKFGEYDREYEVYLPQNFQAGMPLVISLHGITETIEVYKTYTILHETADTMGFVIVYPQGIRESWNAGIINPTRWFPDTDDVGFISALVDTMKSHYNIDLGRVYCCGFSLGGHMSFRMAGECGHRFAATASIAGCLVGLADSWKHVFAMPVLKMHGTEDKLIPYEGEGDRWAAEKTIEYWVKNNNCSSPPDTFDFPDIVKNDSCTMQKISYSDCDNETEVVFYKGINMGHSWPDSKTTFSTEGNKNFDINANVEILNFFKKFNNPMANIAYGKSMEISSVYIPSSGETFFINAHTANPENHAVIVYALIYDDSSALQDSIQLFDDGQHNDGNASDNMWYGIKNLPAMDEKIYKVKLKTRDLDAETTQYLHYPKYFTSIGPIVFDHYEITSSDTIPNPGDYRKFKFILRNNGLSSTAKSITSSLISLDTLASFIPGITHIYNDIAADTISMSTTSQYIRFNKNCPDSVYAKFRMDIASDGFVFWSDTFSVFVTHEPEAISGNNQNKPKQFALFQNYPNPFNPVTSIEYQVARASQVDLSIYNILGQKVATLVSEKQPVGNYKVEWDASGFASGIYLYRLETNQRFMSTNKLVLLR